MLNHNINVHNTCSGDMVAVQMDDNQTHLLTPDEAGKLRSDLAYALYLRREARQPFNGKGHVLGYSVKDNARRTILEAAKGIAG